jgi:hypothetical protein
VLTCRRWQDAPTHVRWESARLAEPLVLRRPWRKPWLEREDGTPLPVNESGARWAQGVDGRPVRVGCRFDLLRMGWVLEVDGRPVPSTGAVSRSAGLGLLAGAYPMLLVGGMIGVLLGWAVCTATIAVLRCEGDRSVRRSQAAVVATTGACLTAAVVVLGALAARALGLDPAFYWYWWGPLLRSR